MIKLIGTKECYQSTLLQARPDKKNGTGNSVFQWSWWKISTTFICTHEDSTNAKEQSGFKQVYGGWNKAVRFFLSLGYTTNQAMGKVPKPISTSARRDTPVTVGKLGNVRSGKQAMLTQRKKKRTNWNHSIWSIYADARLPVTKLGGISL